ncbi:MAG: hypothetical protein NVS3B25_25030 [Hymenobacter sp.]
MSYASHLEPDLYRDKTEYTSRPAYSPKPDRVMFEPGDTVRVRQLADHAPRMVVKQAVKVPHETEPGKTRLTGILCFWYLPHGDYCEQLFNTKDLEVLDKARKD